MALEFAHDAICLSGLTGSKLKCEVLGEYYPFWWRITSGGQSARYDYPTAIVELDAATGEVYVEDLEETILGSSGHALQLKCGDPSTKRLKVVLVEKDAECYAHLKNVIGRRWPRVDVDLAEGPLQSNTSGIYLLNKALDDALSDIERIPTGNALFFFDPLRSVEYWRIKGVAERRIATFYKTGTEIIVFVFTSDWFLGRDGFAALPTTVDESIWSPEEGKTVLEADALFGDSEWRGRILNNDPTHKREEGLIEIYRQRLHRWFRYVLPLPFNPKAAQVFHLMLCSNYEVGVRATRDFYSTKTGNPKYSPGNREAYGRFRQLHPELLGGLRGNQRPLEWRLLWPTIRDHEEGMSDCMCTDYSAVEPDMRARQRLLDWLEGNAYLERLEANNAWGASIGQYRLDWPTITAKLGIAPPPSLKPISLRTLSLKEISQ